jgi:hypothetical protein
MNGDGRARTLLWRLTIFNRILQIGAGHAFTSAGNIVDLDIFGLLPIEKKTQSFHSAAVFYVIAFS